MLVSISKTSIVGTGVTPREHQLACPGAMDFTSRLECNHCFDFSVSFFSQDAVDYLSCPFPAPPVMNTCDDGVSLFWSQYHMCTLDPPLKQRLTRIMCLADYVFLVHDF